MRRVLANLLPAAVLTVGMAFASSPGTTTVSSKTPDVAVKASNPAKKLNISASKRRTQVGPASWYGKSFHGRPTASGEPYDMFQFTAAHKTLPLGTWLKVTNLKTNRWVIVKVTDRGPYVGNRIIDLSYGAAQMLNFRAHGVAKVRIEVIDEPQVTARAENLSGSSD